MPLLTLPEILLQYLETRQVHNVSAWFLSQGVCVQIHSFRCDKRIALYFWLDLSRVLFGKACIGFDFYSHSHCLYIHLCLCRAISSSRSMVRKGYRTLGQLCSSALNSFCHSHYFSFCFFCHLHFLSSFCLSFIWASKFIFVQFHLSIFLSFTGRYCAVVLDGLRSS